jgi:uncharacterized repeat protein (TIGR01451 family)
MDQSTVRNNRAGDGIDIATGFAGGGGTGGGLQLTPISSGISSSITHSTFNDNQSGNGGNSGSSFGGFGGSGGAIFYVGPFLGGSSITIANNTIHANHAGNGGSSTGFPGAGGGPGGGIFFQGGSFLGGVADTATLNNNTISDNSAGLGNSGTMAGPDGTGGGLSVISSINPISLRIANTILANNTVGPTGAGPNCAPFPSDFGFNLETGTDCNFLLASDKQNANPMLGPLQDNGGPTFTRALLPGSEALDMGNDGAAPGSGFSACEADDQRGVSRPQGTACDIGAFEAQVADLAVTKTVSNAQVVVGSNVQFTVTVTNNGPTDADFVMVDDTLPAGLTFVSATPDQGTCLFSAGLVMCDLGTIVAGDSVQILIVSTASVEGTQTNNVAATFLGSDPDDTNNTAMVTFVVTGATGVPVPGGQGQISGSGCSLQSVASSEAWGWLWGFSLLSIVFLIHRSRSAGYF